MFMVLSMEKSTVNSVPSGTKRELKSNPIGIDSSNVMAADVAG